MTDECQLMYVEWVIKLRMYHFAPTHAVTDSDSGHQWWMLTRVTVGVISQCTYTYLESLHCTPETDIMYQFYLNEKERLKERSPEGNCYWSASCSYISNYYSTDAY